MLLIIYTLFHHLKLRDFMRLKIISYFWWYKYNDINASVRDIKKIIINKKYFQGLNIQIYINVR